MPEEETNNSNCECEVSRLTSKKMPSLSQPISMRLYV